MGVPKKNAKATKKFEKNHLKGTLEKRKAQVKIKQRVLAKSKKQSKRSQDDAFYKGGAAAEGAAAAAAAGANGVKTAPGKKRHDATVSEMSVDDFFSGGFQIIDDKSTQDGKSGKRKRSGEAKATADNKKDDSESEDEDDLDVADVGMSKEAMDALAEKDPEFYKFLKENDPGALDFDEDADLAEIDDLSAGSDEEEEEEEEEDSEEEDSEDEDEGRPAKKAKKTKTKTKAKTKTPVERDNELTRAMVAQWQQSMAASFSLRAARQTVLAFRCAAHLNEDADAEGSLSQRYAIKSPDVFHDILVAALKHVPLVLQHHVPVKESATQRVYVPTGSKKFKTLGVLVRSFAASVLHLLTTLSDDGTLQLTLSALTPLLPYLLSFRKVLKQLVKSVVGFWAQPASSETTRITAFLVVRRLMVIADKGVREAVLKATYQGLVQGSRATNANTLAGINLMKNSAAALWGVDAAVGYTTAFAAIRQLAIHLRNSIVHNQNNAFRNVYNWQYVHSLDFWSCVLAEHCAEGSESATVSAADKKQLLLLVYPLVQVTLGAMRLIPTAAYFPLRFQLFRSLLRVSRATGTYIPLAPVLVEVLSSADMKKPGKAGASSSTDRQLDFAVAYKAPKSMLHTSAYQTAVGEQVVELLAEYFALWSTSIAFPEFALPVIIVLKRWIKDARKRGGRNGKNLNSKVVGGLVVVAQKLEANAAFIEAQRSQVTFAPRDRTQVDAFLKDYAWQKTPVGAFVVAQRKAGAERQRLLDETRKADDAKRQEDKRKLQAVRVDEEEEDDDDDDVDNMFDLEAEEDDDDDDEDEDDE